ncbi:hypothetical protein A4V04_12950 [Burkholderiales bacterium YL45]|uniref:Uncharacterized protein n=1 Tax=Turicimonas muris TaxID=1796652 RepID=A0A227KS39_9BURK|nr:hypothetical protein A4V04_12950 [Burkholderiales bacterium YL45]OXE50734.1 hypothetical protein ADH67_00030 [Turicimonas muris]
MRDQKPISEEESRNKTTRVVTELSWVKTPSSFGKVGESCAFLYSLHLWEIYSLYFNILCEIFLEKTELIQNRRARHYKALSLLLKD